MSGYLSHYGPNQLKSIVYIWRHVASDTNISDMDQCQCWPVDQRWPNHGDIATCPVSHPWTLLQSYIISHWHGLVLNLKLLASFIEWQNSEILGKKYRWPIIVSFNVFSLEHHVQLISFKLQIFHVFLKHENNCQNLLSSN